jgi:hypothetical protein
VHLEEQCKGSVEVCRILYLVRVIKRVDLEIPVIPVPRIRALSIYSTRIA